jgi:hypothetical protein
MAAPLRLALEDTQRMTFFAAFLPLFLYLIQMRAFALAAALMARFILACHDDPSRTMKFNISATLSISGYDLATT